MALVAGQDYEQIMATFSDGSQVLVWLWNDGHIEVAKRIGKDATWGPPAKGERL
jgi:hypothetical protein